MRLFSSRVPLRHVHEKRQSPQETVSKSLEWNVVSEIQIAEIILKPDLSFAGAETGIAQWRYQIWSCSTTKLQRDLSRQTVWDMTSIPNYKN
jgi:hypothetical protein